MPDEFHRTAPPMQGASAWRRLWTWLRDAEEALETTHDDIQNRRILALEREVASLRAALDTPRGSAAATK